LFLSKAELDYLTSKRQFSEDYSYTIKCRFQKKLKQFTGQELPLLVEQGYLTEFCKLSQSNLTENCKTSSNDPVEKETTRIMRSDINIMFEEKRLIPKERGSPSLVGRGIANPMSERTRGFELPERNGTKFPLPAPLSFS
jgi:hypothetical protein